MKRITRVDLVDRPASYDPVSGEGSAVVILKRAGGPAMNHSGLHSALSRANSFVAKFAGPDAERPTVSDALEAEQLVESLAGELVLKAQPAMAPETAVAKLLNTSVGKLLYQVATLGRR
jgi:hypothetical protein